MIKWKYDPPALVKTLFPEYFWETSNNKLLLTFDDGPVPGNTGKILEVLEKKRIKALFFCVGENLQNNTELTGEILAAGHTIGNHTFDHQRITRQKTPAIIENLGKVNKVAEDRFGYNIKYFRPPHGRFDLRTSRILNSAGMKNVMWSLLTFDWRNDFAVVKNAVDTFIKFNSIIVMHDSLRSKDIIIDSINYLIERADEKGYIFGEPEECLK